MDECTTHFTTLARNHQVVPWPSSTRPPLMLWKRWCLRFRILSGPCPCLNSVSKWNGPTRSWPRIVRDSNHMPYTIDVSIVWHAHSQWEFLMVLFWMGVAVGIRRVAKLRSLFLRGVEVTDEITKRLSSHEPAPMEEVFWSGQLQHFYFCLLNLLYWWTPIKHYIA